MQKIYFEGSLIKGELISIHVQDKVVTVIRNFEQAEIIEGECRQELELEYVYIFDQASKNIENYQQSVLQITNMSKFKEFLSKENNFDIKNMEDSATSPRYHFVFSEKLTVKELIVFLNKFYMYSMLNNEELDRCKLCIQAYCIQQKIKEQRMKEGQFAEQFRLLNLYQDREQDTKEILHWISLCKDNDFLLILHRYLSQAEFNYFRETKEGDGLGFLHYIRWRGTVHDKIINYIPKEWAKIEKALSLQMIHNIAQELTDFSQKKQRALSEKLAHSCKFFNLIRKTKSDQMESTEGKEYRALYNGNYEALKKKREKIFNL